MPVEFEELHDYQMLHELYTIKRKSEQKEDYPRPPNHKAQKNSVKEKSLPKAWLPV